MKWTVPTLTPQGIFVTFGAGKLSYKLSGKV